MEAFLQASEEPLLNDDFLWVIILKNDQSLPNVKLKSSKFPTLTSSILVAQVREPPDVREVHCKANDRQQEVNFFGPGFSFLSRRMSLAGRRNEGGGGELNAILLLHQDQLHLFGSCGARGIGGSDDGGHECSRSSASEHGALLREENADVGKGWIMVGGGRDGHVDVTNQEHSKTEPDMTGLHVCSRITTRNFEKPVISIHV